MKYFSMFSGVGGFEIGLETAYREAYRRIEEDSKGKDEGREGLESTKGQSLGIEGGQPSEYSDNGREGCQQVVDRGYEDKATIQIGTSERPDLPNGWDIRNVVSSGGQQCEGKPIDTGSKPTCVGYSEIDKYAIQVYERHFPGVKNYGDATKINTADIPDFDLLVGGFPCVAFSIAGKRGGFSDTRGTLFFEIARIASAKQPLFMLLENVKGLVSHDKGKTLEIILETLQELGYYCNWEVYNSKDHRVPQNRERIFFKCHHVKGLESVGQNQSLTIYENFIQDYLFQTLLNNSAEVKKLQGLNSKDSVLGFALLKDTLIAIGHQATLKSLKTIYQNLSKHSWDSSLASPLMASMKKQKNLEDQHTVRDGILMAMEENRSAMVKGDTWLNLGLLLSGILEENYPSLATCTTSIAIKQIIDLRIYTFFQMFLVMLLATTQLRNLHKNLWQEILLNLIVIREGTKYARINNQTQEAVVTESGTMHFTQNLQDLRECFFIGHLRGECTEQVFPLGSNSGQNEAEGGEESGGKSWVSTLDSRYGQRWSAETYVRTGVEDTRPKGNLPDGTDCGGRETHPDDRSQGRGEGNKIKVEGNLYESNHEQGNVYSTEDAISPALMDRQTRGGMGKAPTIITHNLKPQSSNFGKMISLHQKRTGKYGNGEKSLDESSFTLDTNKDLCIANSSRIRRLIPVECERLQGFPDSWTEKGIDRNGNETIISDTQRYKMMGNAVTTNVVRDIVANWLCLGKKKI